MMMGGCDSLIVSYHDQENMWSTARSYIPSASSWGIWLDRQGLSGTILLTNFEFNAGQAYSETELNQFGLFEAQNGFQGTLVQNRNVGDSPQVQAYWLALHTADAASRKDFRHSLR